MKAHGRNLEVRKELSDVLSEGRNIDCGTLDIMYRDVLPGKVVLDVDDMLRVLKEAEKRLELFTKVRSHVLSDGVNKSIFNVAGRAFSKRKTGFDLGGISSYNFYKLSSSSVIRLGATIGRRAFEELLDGSSDVDVGFVSSILSGKCMNERFRSSSKSDFFSFTNMWRDASIC